MIVIWTVGELVEKLNKYDKDLEIVVETFEGDTLIKEIEIAGKVVLIRLID